VEVLSADVLADGQQLKVVGDVNAVPPLGVEGIKRMDNGVSLRYATHSPNAVGIGALAVGNVKYQLQNRLLALLLETETPVYLDFRDAFQKARELV